MESEKGTEFKGKTLGSNKLQTIGQTKSKQPWKKLSRRSDLKRRANPQTWQRKVEDRKNMKRLKEKI